MTRALSIAALLALALLGACGFQPMYATPSSGQSLDSSFGAIEIAPIPERIGQMVHNHLLDRINPYGAPDAPDYLLRVALEETIEGFGFRSDEAITRESFTLEGDIQLLDAETGNVVLEETLRSVHTYDIVQSDFANYSAREDAKARTAEELSSQITIRLALYLKSLSGSL